MAAGQNCPKSNCWYQKPMTKICNLMGLMCRSIKKLVDWETLGRTCNVQYVFFGRNWATWVHSILNVFFFLHSWMGTWTNILYTFTILNIFFRWGYFLGAKIGYQRILFFFCRVSKFIWGDFCYPKAKHTGESMGNTFFWWWTIQQIQLKANVSHDTKHAAWQSQTKMQRAWVTACDIAGDCHMVAYISDHWIGINILKFF